MSDFSGAKLLKAYNEEVMKYSQIRELMGKLVQDAGKETLDSKASGETLREFLEDNRSKKDAALGEPRRAIISFLNEMWLIGLKNFSKEFWWEMRYRIMKLLHVSIVLEALNLKSFGVTKARANEKDIPQCLMFVYDFVKKECTNEKLKKVEEEFSACCKDQKDFCDLYLNVF